MIASTRGLSFGYFIGAALPAFVTGFNSAVRLDVSGRAASASSSGELPSCSCCCWFSPAWSDLCARDDPWLAQTLGRVKKTGKGTCDPETRTFRNCRAASSRSNQYWPADARGCLRRGGACLFQVPWRSRQRLSSQRGPFWKAAAGVIVFDFLAIVCAVVLCGSLSLRRRLRGRETDFQRVPMRNAWKNFTRLDAEFLLAGYAVGTPAFIPRPTTRTL
jgi:hypothetical protein